MDEVEQACKSLSFDIWREKLSLALGYDPVAMAQALGPGNYKPPDRYERLVIVAQEQEHYARRLVMENRLYDKVDFVRCVQTSQQHWPLEMEYYVPVEKATGKMLLVSDLLKMRES